MAPKKTLAELKRHERVNFILAERLMQVLEQIEAQEERYDHDNPGDWQRFDFKRHEVKCNSACCFAGHTVAMFADEGTPDDIREDEVVSEAVRLLEIYRSDYAGFHIFFDFAREWPVTFKNEWGRVAPACVRRRIEHYIETGSMFP